ncbi:MAG: endonuclease [Oscillospiraceae bacterium]|nr:endonuclease [Oscillospiraceae bacterium]
MNATTRDRDELQSIYDTLLAHYGDLHWWPAKSPYEVMVGAILTQNTAWGNVEKAIANFGGGLSPGAVLSAGRAELIDIIRPAGFFNQKAGYLVAVTEWFSRYSFDVEAVRRAPPERVRGELLSVRGVGQETADSMLLYAFGIPTFVVDAYTVRLCGRYPLSAGDNYTAVKSYFEANLPRCEKVFNNYHALIVINGKTHCRKSRPSCDRCPLCARCSKQGI